MKQVLINDFKIDYENKKGWYLCRIVLGDPNKNHLIITGRSKKFNQAINEVINKISKVKQAVEKYDKK